LLSLQSMLVFLPIGLLGAFPGNAALSPAMSTSDFCMWPPVHDAPLFVAYNWD
jgi:hypothetical protein